MVKEAWALEIKWQGCANTLSDQSEWWVSHEPFFAFGYLSWATWFSARVNMVSAECYSTANFLPLISSFGILPYMWEDIWHIHFCLLFWKPSHLSNRWHREVAWKQETLPDPFPWHTVMTQDCQSAYWCTTFLLCLRKWALGWWGEVPLCPPWC